MLAPFGAVRKRLDVLATILGVIALIGAVIAFTVLSYTAPDPELIYDPVRAGERLPPGFRQVLTRDAIRPIYDPVFVPADATPWDDDTLVIGIEQDGEGKAYPVSFLNRREMAIDSIAGIPVLVTW